MKIAIFGAAAVALTLLAGASCTPVPSVESTAAPAVERVWPPPPAEPRIRYLYSLSSARDLNIQEGLFRKFLRVLKGAPERPIVHPYGVHVDAAGRVYVVDTFYKAVKVFDTAEGRSYWFPEEPIEGFENPIDIALSQDGELYVSDSQSKLIHVFRDAGREYAGAFGQGMLERPTGLTFDVRTGRLLVVDTKGSRLLVFDPKARGLQQTIGENGVGDSQFHFPTSITLSTAGRIYIVDSLNFRVQVLDRDFSFLARFGAAGDAPGYFARPKGIATDTQGNLYVVDALFDNVQLFGPDGRLLMAFGETGQGPGAFWLPNDIFIDASDKIYVSDSQNHRVQVFQLLNSEGTHP